MIEKNGKFFVLVSILLWNSLFAQQVTFAADKSTSERDDSLLAHYPLIEDVKDVSGNEKHGEAVGNITFTDGLTLPGGTNSNTNYVKLPDGLFDQQDHVTISTWLKSNTSSGNYSALFFGTPANASKVPENYWLFNPTDPSGNFKSVFTNSLNSSAPWTTEVGVTSTNTTGNKGVWTHYTTVITPTSVTGYMNGEKIGTTKKTKTVSDFGAGLNAYIGRSNYLNDHTFAGSFQNLRIYGEALDDTSISSIYEEEKTQLLIEQDKKNLTLGDTSAVIGNLTLPTTGNNGTTITWKSSNDRIISNTGVVSLTDKEQTATLTATIALGDYQATKDFTITLVSLQNITKKVANDLYIPYVLSENVELPSSRGPASISWSSSNLTVIGHDGMITPPSEGMTDITLTAIISYDEQQSTKVFKVKVIESSPAHILSYLRAGSSVVTDAMHLGYSADGTAYTALNNNTGVLFPKADFKTSVKGDTKKLVDPYIFRMEDGAFGVVATRLNGNGTQNQEEKSSILLFKSSDLLSFEEIGLITLNTDETVTKPIAEYDASSEEYRIEWENLDGTRYYNTTRDFKTVSDPKSGAKIKVEEIKTGIRNTIPSNHILVTKAEGKQIKNKLTKVINTEISNVKVKVNKNEDFSFEDLSKMKVTASYSDGSTADKVVNWNKEQFKQIDFSQKGTYTVSGTVKQSNYPKEMIKGYADPNVFWYNGKYYFIATNENGQRDLNIREADTILKLKDAASSRIFEANPSGDMSGSIWAPELHSINGDLYIFFAAGRPYWNTVQSYVMKLKEGGDPLAASDWESPNKVLNKDGGYLYTEGITLDMTYFEHHDEHYVIWAQRFIGDPNGSSDLYIAKINPLRPWELMTDPIRMARPYYGWERWTTEVIEGAYVLKHGDKVFVTFSGSGVDPTYSIGLLTANEDSDLLDPASWTKTNYPILNSESVPGEYGPGHNSYVLDEDGELVNVYHTMPQSGGHRNTSIRKVHWAADGTPVLDMVLDREILPENRAVTATIIVDGAEHELDTSYLLSTLEDHQEDLSEKDYRALTLHLIAVGQFEKKGSAEKVIKHMESFKKLLDYQLENESISQELYETLKADSNSLIQKWQEK